MNNVVRCYTLTGFHIAVMIVDIQFKAFKDRNFLGVEVNVVSKEDHVPKIESWHRVIKKRECCYHEMLPFDYFLRMIVTHLMKTVVFYVRAFAWRRGVYQITPLLTTA